MRGGARSARSAAALLLVAGAAFAEGSGWGADINPGRGPKLIDEVRPELLKVVKATEAQRAAAVRAFAETADATGEAWKRFRNTELRPLFLALLDRPDWHTAHRALFALERMPDRAALKGAWKLLSHSERRLREKAAITCIKLWDNAAAKDLSQGDARNALESMLSIEPDFHVRRCFEALRRRMDGKLPVEKVYEEFTVKGPDGLVFTPFLDGMDKAPAVAPGYAAKGVSQGGGSSAMKLPVADAWTTPLLGYGEEEVPGTGLQPFANPREGGRVHTGQDVGACLDGAGYYAAADGVVKFVHSGSDMGTLLVLEHHLDEKGVVCAVYMHGGDTVFVKGGDRVEQGQLLGSMGMSFSLENGGHFAHLHYGLYPGPFQSSHNYGYKLAAAGLDDWLDPAKCLPRWKDGSLPEAGEDPPAVVARATRLRKAGWPARAIWVLTAGEKSLKGKPGAEVLAATELEWTKDRLFMRALVGEAKIDALREAAAKAGPKEKDRVKEQWKKLLEEYGDTDLAPRIQEEAK
jgi:murein DD-endopeptidase MepM/ murein hydrolase activator NlpD